MSKKILIVSSEGTTANFISLELQKLDYQVDIAEDGKTGLDLALRYDYNLILLDFVLFDMTCEGFSGRLAKQKPAQVIMVVGSAELIKRHSKELTRFAVSVISKPFVIEELVDSIQRIFRGRDFIDQHCSQMQVKTVCGDLQIDVQNHLVYRGEDLINLTRREYDLLATLMNSGTTLTREQLLERVWKYESATETNVVDVYIRYLRGKIDIKGAPSYIKTVRGVGYAMQD